MQSTTLQLLLIAAIGAGGAPAQKAKILREPIEWLEIRVNDANRSDFPRVLLIGDSISGGYFNGVADELKGKAYVARLGTSKALGDPALLDEIRIVLSQYRFAVIHFNVVLHGWDYSEDDYRVHFPELLEVLKKNAPGAKLIWATTTPRRTGPPDFKTFDDTIDRIRERNRIAAGLIAKEGIPVDDLYSLIENHPEYMSDGTHYKPEGYALMAKQVTRAVLAMLK